MERPQDRVKLAEQRRISIHRIRLDLVSVRIGRFEKNGFEPEQVRDLGRYFTMLRRRQEVLPIVVGSALVRPNLLGPGVGRARASGVASREIKDVECVDVITALFEKTLDKLFPLLARAQVVRAENVSAAVPLAQELVARFSREVSL